MKPSYKTLTFATDQLIIKKSRFITYIYGIESEEDAQKILSSIRDKYKDATHVCYAYVLTKDGNIERFCDDGEPSGTAGMPMLDIIKNSGNSQVLAVVVRYFGGIKLGGGGLVRAYAECVKNCILKATTIEYQLSDIYQFSIEYSLCKKFSQLLANIVCKTLEISYNDRGAVYRVAVPVASDFVRQVTDFTLGNVTPTLIESRYINY